MPTGPHPFDNSSNAPEPDHRLPYDASVLAAVHSLVAELRHELGNPLNSIKAALTLVRRSIDTFPAEKTLTYLDATLAEVARLERLLIALRRLSEPSAHPIEPIEIVPLLEEFLAQYGYEVERRGIIFSSKIHAAGRAVLVDQEALKQVLLDLLSDAAQRLGRVEEPRLEISAFPLGNFYIIELRSNGRAATEGRELPFVSQLLGPREEDYRLALAISRQILLQTGSKVLARQDSKETFVSCIELPLEMKRAPAS